VPIEVAPGPCYHAIGRLAMPATAIILRRWSLEEYYRMGDLLP